jgi:hypothetical protein
VLADWYIFSRATTSPNNDWIFLYWRHQHHRVARRKIWEKAKGDLISSRNILAIYDRTLCKYKQTKKKGIWRVFFLSIP